MMDDSEDRKAAKSQSFTLRNLFNPTKKSKKSQPDHTEMSFAEMDQIIQNFLNSEEQQLSSDYNWTRSVSVMLECQICLTNQPINTFYKMSSCSHRFCATCLKTFLETEITESRIDIQCPDCTEKMKPSDIRNILKDENSLLMKYEDFMLRRMLISDPGVRWCPAPDCGYAVVATGCERCPRLKCERPGCNTHFCFNCKDYWHQNDTCDAEILPAMTPSSTSPSDDAQVEDIKIKPCPKCSSPIEKLLDGSCNHMVCPVCAVEFCWLCMQPITANMIHYMGPSGCSFWGKKPMSKKKRVLTHLATLFGAPVAVPVMAGLAVPAMIVGLPVWAGKKIHSKLKHKPAPQRKLAVAAGVAASALTSPVVAGVAVGIGVPASLAYIYATTTKALISGSLGVKNVAKE